MTLVVDASVALKWFVEEPGSAPARRLLVDDAALVAPDLLLAEVFNAAWRLLRSGGIAAPQYDVVITRLVPIFSELVALPPIAARAAGIARTLDHPVYDCLYLALAERAGSRLVTADRRFVDRVADTPWQSLVDDLYAMPA